MKVDIKKNIPMLAAIIFPLHSFAAPTITFQGEVTDQTCSISVNGQTNSVILMPTVSTSEFGETLTNAQSAGQTAFTVSVSDCTASASSAQSISTNFLGHSVDANSGVLTNSDSSANAAEGFGVQLMDAGTNGKEVKLAGVTSVPGLTLAAGQTKTSHDYGARYYVLSAKDVKPGKITAVVEYTLSYF